MNGSFDPIYFVHFDKTHTVLWPRTSSLHTSVLLLTSLKESNENPDILLIFQLITKQLCKLYFTAEHWIGWKFYCTGFPANWRTYESTFVWIEEVLAQRKYISPASISKDLYSGRWYTIGLLFLFFWTSEIWPIVCISPWYSGTETIIFYSTFCFRKMQHLA